MPANRGGRSAVLNVWNRDGNIILLEFSHASISTQRLAMATDDVTSTLGGGSPVTFTAYPFELDQVTDDKGVPRGGLRISNVTALIWNLIGDLAGAPPQINLYRVLESDVDTIQDQFLGLDVKRVAADMLTVECEFGHENYAIEPYPAARVIPPRCPWITYVG